MEAVLKIKKAKAPKCIGRQLLIAAIFFVSAMFIETITFILLGFNSLPQYLLFNISALLIIIGFVLLIPSSKVQFGIFIAIISLQIVLGYLNVTLYGIFGTIVTIDMINLVGEAAAAMESSVLNIRLLVLFVLLGAAYIGVNIFFQKKYKPSVSSLKIGKLKFSLIMAICIAVSQLLGVSGYSYQVHALRQNSTPNAETFLGDDYMLYDTLLFGAESLKKFGTFAFYAQDISSTFLKTSKNKEERLSTAMQHLINGHLAEQSVYGGISKGNNVIVVMAESLEWYGMDEYFTPTLYNLYENHVGVKGFYSKSKTNISEAFGFLGSYPLSQTFASVIPGAAKLSENNFEFSLPNLLKKEGYVGANYFINHEKGFYRRDQINKKFGFDNVYDIKDFNIKDSNISYWGDWVLDSEFFLGAKDSIAPVQDEPFFSWVTTMITHGPYEGNHRLKSYVEKIKASSWVNPLKGTESEEHLVNYISAVMDFDYMMELLLQDLLQKDLLDKTTIIVYADHETYYHDLGLKVKGIAKEHYNNTEIYRVPLFIYDQNLPSLQINDFVSLYDIMPTIMDLLDINYNSNKYMGSSLFLENRQTQPFMSLTGGVFDESMFTVNGIDVVARNGSNPSEKEKREFLEKVELLVQKVLIFNDLYIYNLLGY